jgi:hypothetical protein
MNREHYLMRTTIMLVLIASFTVLTACSPAKPQTFETPEAAVQALIEAAQTGEVKPVLKVLGEDAKPLIESGDPVADKNGREEFVAGYNEAHSLDKTVADAITLEVGADKWPFPFPIVKGGDGWHFDSAAGAEELINRRVGENELSTIQSCLAFVDAEREYYMLNVEKSSLQHYASKLISAEGKKDGLYWPTGANEEPSPLGEAFAKARAEGYLQEGEPRKGAPFHGYIYRLLTSQGPNAAGGAYDYLVNDVLLGGFALVAFPAEYGNSGIMTFIVNHDGVVYSQDLGPDTTKLALAIDKFDPAPPWKREQSEDVIVTGTETVPAN